MQVEKGVGKFRSSFLCPAYPLFFPAHPVSPLAASDHENKISPPVATTHSIADCFIGQKPTFPVSSTPSQESIKHAFRSKVLIKYRWRRFESLRYTSRRPHFGHGRALHRRCASKCPSVQFKQTGLGWVTGRALPGCHQFNIYALVDLEPIKVGGLRARLRSR